MWCWIQGSTTYLQYTVWSFCHVFGSCSKSVATKRIACCFACMFVLPNFSSISNDLLLWTSLHNIGIAWQHPTFLDCKDFNHADSIRLQLQDVSCWDRNTGWNTGESRSFHIRFHLFCVIIFILWNLISMTSMGLTGDRSWAPGQGETLEMFGKHEGSTENTQVIRVLRVTSHQVTIFLRSQQRVRSSETRCWELVDVWFQPSPKVARHHYWFSQQWVRKPQQNRWKITTNDEESEDERMTRWTKA